MVMSVYLVLKFSSGLKVLKKEGKRSETISAPVVRAHQKQMPTSKKSVKLFNSRRLSIWTVAELINTDKETVWQILHNNFAVKKVCLKVVPRLLTPEQKEIRMNICADILQNIEKTQTFREHNNLWWIMVFSIWRRK